MTWRLPRAEWEAGRGERNKQALRSLVNGAVPPGVLAYAADEPAGWCAVAPRAAYVRLQKSRVLAPVDEVPVWSISCLFIAKPFRRQGVSVHLIGAAAEFARAHGARVVEAYPVVPYSDAMPAPFAWTGTISAYERAGFREVARRSEARPIVRRGWGKAKAHKPGKS
jgi:GNAT superfamily N-acetyltransferase